MARKSDTKAIADKPMKNPKGGNESTTITIRPIENGYLKSESRYGDNGDYSCRETYSQQRPTTATETPQSNLMADAIKSIKK